METKIIAASFVKIVITKIIEKVETIISINSEKFIEKTEEITILKNIIFLWKNYKENIEDLTNDNFRVVINSTHYIEYDNYYKLIKIIKELWMDDVTIFDLKISFTELKNNIDFVKKIIYENFKTNLIIDITHVQLFDIFTFGGGLIHINDDSIIIPVCPTLYGSRTSEPFFKMLNKYRAIYCNLA